MQQKEYPMRVDRLTVTQTTASLTLHLYNRPIVRYGHANDYTKLIG